MKTILPERIETREQAVEFLTQLYQNDEAYHPDDDARDQIDVQSREPLCSHDEGKRLNKLMCDIRRISVDPCDILMDLIHTDDEKDNENFGAAV